MVLLVLMHMHMHTVRRERKKKIIDIIWELLLPDAKRQHPQGWKQHLVGVEQHWYSMAVSG